MRVLVTRPKPEAEATAARLTALGHQPLVIPLFHAEAVPATIDGGATALAVTSPRAVAFLPTSLAEAMRARPAFAVGDRTAGALRAAGFRDVRSAVGDVAALGRLIGEAGLPAGSIVLSPGGETRAGDLGALLAAAGLRLDAPAIYRVISVPSLPPALRDAVAREHIDATLHYSPNASAAFRRLVDEAGLAGAAAGLVHACLSEAVAAPLRDAGWPRLAVAGSPDEEALLTALAR